MGTADGHMWGVSLGALCVRYSVSELHNVKMEDIQTSFWRIQLQASVLTIIGCNCWIAIHDALRAKEESPKQIADDTGNWIQNQV